MFDSWRDLEGTIFGQNQIFPGFFDGHLPQSCLAFFVKKRTAEHRVFSQRVAHIFTITSDSSISRNKNKNKRQKYIWESEKKHPNLCFNKHVANLSIPKTPRFSGFAEPFIAIHLTLPGSRDSTSWHIGLPHISIAGLWLRRSRCCHPPPAVARIGFSPKVWGKKAQY